MANKSIDTRCDAGCEMEFTINKFRTKKVKNGIEKNYFICPNCKHEYITHYASAETLQLQKDMRKLHRDYAKYNQLDDDLQYGEFLMKESELKVTLKQSMDDARAIAEG